MFIRNTSLLADGFSTVVRTAKRLLCTHVLREFDWLAPAVLRAAEAHQLPDIPALQPAFALVREMDVQLVPEPEP